MTSLDMKGFSISLLPLDAEVEAALLSEVLPHAWPKARRAGEPAIVPIPAGVDRAAPTASPDARRRKLIDTICRALVAMQPELDALDAKVGDGDTGSTLATAARDVLSAIDSLPLADPASLCFALEGRLSKVMGGSSGVLLSIFAAAMGAAFASGARAPAALRAGISRMQEYGGAREGDRTMLDALVPAVTALEADGSLASAAAAARHGAEGTESMTSARSGRSSYLRADSLHGVRDPGAAAVAGVLSALAETE
jgi:dihydroxyacetone kinase